MKKVLLSVLIGLCAISLKAQDISTDRTDKVECKYVIDGHFFNELDKSLSSPTLIPLRTSDNKRVVGVVLQGGSELSAEVLAKEIPFENVANGAEILQLYEDKVFWVGLARQKIEEGREMKTGMQLDEFSCNDFDETVWDNKRISGKVTVINVWYSGCGPCLAEMPIISKWKEDFPDVNFLSVDYEKKEKMQQIVERRGFTWTHLYGDRYFTTWVVTNTTDSGFPLTIVVDKDGVIRHVVHGTDDEKRAAVVEAIKNCL